MNKTNGAGAAARLISLMCITVMLFSALAAVPARADGNTETVKVGYMLLDNFLEQEEVVQGGKTVVVRTGYGYEYLQMLRNYTGWEYEYVIGTWEELTDKLASGEIDLLTHVAHNEERDKLYLFGSEPQGLETHYLYVDGPSHSIDPSDYSTLNGKNIGVIAGDFRTEQFKKWCGEHSVSCNIIEYPDIHSIHAALHSNEIHATSASSLSIASCPDGKWRALIRFEDTSVYFATTNSERGARLIAQINNAQKRIHEINENYGIELQQKYANRVSKDNPVLTEAEKTFLAEKGTLRVGYCDNRPPLAYTNANGELAGLLADYLRAMTREYGIRFETKVYSTGEELLAALQNGEVDIISPVGYQYGMAEAYGMAITNPITVETMVAVYKGYKGTEPKDIFETVAIISNSITEKDYAKRFYPDSEWVKADSIGEAIDLVANDEAGCYIIRSSTWSWYKNEYEKLNKLQVLTLPESNEVNMAIRNEDIALLPILNSGISLLTDADISQAMVTYSEAAKETGLFDIMRRNLFATASVMVAAALLFVLLIVLYRLSAEKKYHARLETANKKAETARREAELAREEAERANKAKSTFLTSMSHDIRTPMNAIVGMTTLAGKHIDDRDYVKNCLSKVTLASDHLLTLINDVLDINKIESGNLSLTPSVFSLADSIMNLANIGRHQLSEKNHHFEIRVHNISQEYLFADELRINQIFINLLSNAVKYTPVNGKIVIDVKEECIEGDRGKIRLIFVIEDTGIGMTEEFQEHMYELFTMANRNSGKVLGSGVGLSICKQLIDLMEGTIECRSEVGRGTKFTVTLELPIADKITEQVLLPKMKMLLVDDDDVFLTTASETLREIGLLPDCAESGEEAVRIVTEKHRVHDDYPLIIIDWQMPDMDGIETTRRIRRVVGEDVSIIVISAHSPEDIRDQALAAGANGFINKPFFRSFAYQSISEILGFAGEKSDMSSDVHKKVDGMRLLVAEDNELNWELARELLAMYHITSERAENGARCLEMLRDVDADEYDAILMDIQMPGMDGYEAARVIRDGYNENVRSIPIVAMTADAYNEDVVRCLEAGMNAHIAKPIDMERLLEVLSSFRK